MTADVAGDLAATGGMANVHGIVQVELGDQVIEIVGVGIEIIAVPGLCERPCPRRSCAMQR